MDFSQMSRSQTQEATTAKGDAGLRQHMLHVYNLLGGGLFLSALIAFVSVRTGIFYAIASNPMLNIAVQFSPLIVLFFLMFKMNSMSVKGLRTTYWVFVSLKGLALSYIFAVYGMGDISRALFITAIVFGSVSLYGYTTKRDLTGFGSFLMMGVWGIFLTMMATWVLSMFGVDTSIMQFALFSLLTLVVIGLTAYETQQLKHMYYRLSGDALQKVAIMTTLNLYINIVIIFQYVLQLLGGRE